MGSAHSYCLMPHLTPHAHFSSSFLPSPPPQKRLRGKWAPLNSIARLMRRLTPEQLDCIIEPEARKWAVEAQTSTGKHVDFVSHTAEALKVGVEKYEVWVTVGVAEGGRRKYKFFLFRGSCMSGEGVVL